MSDNHDLLNDNDMCSFSGHEAEDMCFNCGDHTGILCSITKLDFDQIPGHSIITDKRVVAIALIMKVKGSAFLSAVCIKKSRIQIQNNSLWQLYTVNFLTKYSANCEELV